MTQDTTINPTPIQPSLLKQTIVAIAIALVGFGLHKGIQWRETNILPTPVTSIGQNRLNAEDIQLARTAWRYFQKNRLSTGLVSSAADFPSTTMWDVGSQLAGMVAAR